MAGGEKKGLFGKLFGRKEKTEEPKREKRQTRPPRTPARQGKKDAQQSTPSKAAEESPEKDAKKSDAVELELDIPEHEISTVALSVADLDVSLLPEDHPVETPSLSAKQPVSAATPLNGSELETIDETTEIKLDATQLRAGRERAATVDDSAPGIPADKESPPRPPDDRQAPSKDVRTDLSAQDDDDFEIELDVGEEEPRVAVPEESASAPVGSLTTQAEPKPSSTQTEPEPSAMTEEEAEAITSGRVAMQYGFPEYVAEEEAAVEEAALAGLLAAAPAEASEAEPRVSPSAIADTPLADERVSTMTPAMIARAEALARVVETCQTPIRIQVHGEAGSGKTTLLHAVGARLTQRVMPLWLSARDYAGFGRPGRVSWLFLEDFLASLEKRLSVADDDFVKSVQQARRHLRLAAQAEAWPTEPEVEASGQEQTNASPEALTASELRSELSGLVHRGLEIAVADKLCVFLDDVHRLDGVTAVEIMEAAHTFLALENCVIVAVCDSEALRRGAVERYPEAADDGIPYLERIFQLSVSVPVDHGAMGLRLQGLLATVAFPCSEVDLEDYVRLQRYSIGPNPRREKRVINRLVLLSKLWPDVCGSDDGDPAAAVNRKLLFGLVCLEMAFPRVFRLLLSVLPQERDLALLLQEGLRAREELLSLDRDFSLFPKDSDREGRSQRLIAFLDSLVDILLNGDRNRRVDAQSTHTLSNLLRLVDAAGPSSAVDWCDDGPRGASLTEFCRRVVDHLQRPLAKRAPDVVDRRIRIQSSGNAWFSLRYSADNNTKAAWGPGRLFYELSFSPENVASVALKCDTVRAAELGVPSEAIEGLNRLPVVQQGRFRFKGYGTGWVEIVTVLHACSCHSGSDPVAHEVESVAAALRELVIGTRDVLDVPLKDVTPVPQAPEQTQVQCKVCKNPLEPVILKDGSQAYKCGACRKIYKVKPLAKPAK